MSKGIKIVGMPKIFFYSIYIKKRYKPLVNRKLIAILKVKKL